MQYSYNASGDKVCFQHIDLFWLAHPTMFYELHDSRLDDGWQSGTKTTLQIRTRQPAVCF